MGLGFLSSLGSKISRLQSAGRRPQHRLDLCSDPGIRVNLWVSSLGLHPGFKETIYYL